MSHVIETVAGQHHPHEDSQAQSDYVNPDVTGLRERLYGIVDGYMKDHQLDQNFAPGRTPYEYLSPAEQAQASGQSADASNTQTVAPATPVAAQPVQAAKTQDPQIAVQQADAGADPSTGDPNDLIPRYNKAAFAAALQAKREGIDPSALALTPPKALAQQNVAQQQQAMNDISNFIRNGSRGY